MFKQQNIVQKCIQLLQNIEIKDTLISENDIIQTYIDVLGYENPTTFEMNNIHFKNLYECRLIDNICSKYVINKLTNNNHIDGNIENTQLIRNERFNNIKYKHFEWYKSYYDDILYHKKIFSMLQNIFTDEGAKKIKLYHDGLAYNFNIYDSTKDWVKGTSMELFYKK
jgi:hypothetical protein